MKKPVMQRSMFMANAPKSESKGILSYFDEEMDNEDYAERTPENLEIIANNLRGDIRSMDERYLELAQMVGEAAFDTPEEVVTLMQAQMGQQQPMPPTPAPQAGIGGLASAGAPPAMGAQPQGIMQGVAEQPAAPQPQMPTGQAPVQMADGGLVYRQAGSPPSGEIARRTIDEDLLRRGLTPRPNFAQQSLRNLGNMLYNFDQGLSSRLAGSLQTGAPTSASGKPIPFVDKRGRIYQPVGGTNPNMASRGMPMPSKFNPLNFATRFAGPAAAFGLPLTQSLIESDANKGQLYGSMFGLETGEETAGLVGGEPVFEPPVTPPQPDYSAEFQMGAPFTASPTNEEIEQQIGAPLAVPVPSKREEEEAAPEVTRAEPKTFKDRVKDKIDIYKEVLGDDENMRQAQALFLLAEAALNVAGATGRSTGERLAKGLRGLPAGMGALGAEKSKQDMAIKTAAISAVESEMAAEAKSSTQLMMKIMEAQAKGADTQAIADYLVQTQGFTPEKATQVARLNKAGAIKTNDAGEMVDLTGRVVHSPFKLVEGDVGFLPADGSIPFVSVGKRSMVPATAKDRSALATEMSNNQAMAAAIERTFALPAFESMTGPLAKIQSGFTSVLTPFFGANVPFTDLSKDVQKNVARELRNQLIQLNARNTSRPSVWEQKQVEKFIADPDAILTSPDEFFGILNNFRVQAINRANEIEHQLNGTPLKQLEYIPMGTAKDPLKAKDAAYLGEFFRLRPNGSIYIELEIPSKKDPNKTVTEIRKFTAQEWFKQTGQQ